jgi:hypothetical protein
MSFIEFHKGCGNASYCMGPRSPYITIFGTEWWFLIPHFIVSLFIGWILLRILYSLKKKEKIKLDSKIIILISIATILLMFFLLAFLFPVRVIY